MATPWTLFKATLGLRAFGFSKIPLLGFARPSVLALSEERCVVLIRLRRGTKNHLGSMYFGALAIGADCAGGLIAAHLIRQQKAKVALVFKSFQASFLKRPEADVSFVCEDGAKIKALLDLALSTGERQTTPVAIRAEVQGPEGPETVAEFTLELSLKQSTKGAF